MLAMLYMSVPQEWEEENAHTFEGYMYIFTHKLTGTAYLHTNRLAMGLALLPY